MSNKAPLVTVLVASYNHEAFIEECLMSIVSQTYENIQLIVIDDESSDSSPLIIQKLADEFNFEFIQQKNTGLATVLNNGIELAKGKYFVSIGSDDKEMVDRIEKQVALMESRPDIAVCAANYVEFDGTGSIVKKPKIPPARELHFDDIFTHRKAGIKAPTAMVRTEVFKEVGGYDPAINLEDIYMWLKITAAGHKAYVTEDIVACYRKHSGNQSKNMNFMADSFEAIYGQYKDHPLYKKTINKLLINLFSKSVKRGYSGSWDIFKRINPRFYNMKTFLVVLRAVFAG